MKMFLKQGDGSYRFIMPETRMIHLMSMPFITCLDVDLFEYNR